ncbi:MAG: hypothetical protein KDD62_09675, partial [Bdellovibrionales bacterium]|nr:hypothetical protein [Bdellovibrionales bacterium]
MKVLKVFQALTFIFFVALAQRAHAAPGLKVSFKDANSKLAFSFSPSPSVTDCSYEIFGSERKNLIRRKSPAKKASLAEFGKLDPDGEDFQISELPHIKKTKKQKKRVAYFRLRETCNTSSSGSAVKKLRLPSSKKNGSTSKIWFQEISKQFEYFNLRYTDAFPQLTFTRPSDIRNANDGSNRLFV